MWFRGDKKILIEEDFLCWESVNSEKFGNKQDLTESGNGLTWFCLLNGFKQEKASSSPRHAGRWSKLILRF